MLDVLDLFDRFFSVFLLLLLAGVCFIVGYSRLKRKQINWNALADLELQKQLNSWQIDEPASSQAIQDARKRLDTLKAFGRLGIGAGMTLAAITMGLVYTLTDILFIDIFFVLFIPMTICLGASGYWLGEIIGLRKLKQESTRRLAYGDLRQRSAADYRSPLWLIAPILLVTANITITLIDIFNFHSPMRIASELDKVVWIPTWFLLTLPTVMLLVVIGVEMNIRYIAHFPRLLVTTPPALGQRIDDMLRSIMVGTIIELEYCLMACLQMGQSQLLLKSFSGGAPVAIIIPSALIPVTGMIAAFTIICFPALHGHLGGNVSGWLRRGSKGGLRGTAAADR